MQRTYLGQRQAAKRVHRFDERETALLSRYNEDGKLIKVVPYTSGVENGLAREYRADGTLITVTYYRNGYFQKKNASTGSTRTG